MYAAHFAAGLAIGASVRRAPMWALLFGAFLPDLVWISLAAAGVEPAGASVFFDDWSHSLLSIFLQATVFALCFARRGLGVWMPLWLAVVSHFLLDALIHPRPLALHPYSAAHIPWGLWKWGETHALLGFTHYWLVQLGITFPLLCVYVLGMKRQDFAARLAWATVLIVAGLHLIL
jgi:hypothetical protein